jgi:agmatinase
MNSQAFLGSEALPRAAADCQFHVIPVPYEATVSYGSGTAKGPAAILEASQQLEAWTGRSLPLDRGIYTWPALPCSGGAEEVLERIEAAVAAALAAGPQGPLPAPAPGFVPCLGAPALPVILGGEHTVTLGALRALKKRYGRFGLIQFDAHADLRDVYEGTPYSHACVMRRAVDDLGLPLFQVGVRSLCVEEATFRKERGIAHLDSRTARFPLPWRDFAPDEEGSRMPDLLPADFPDKVFLTFDLDAFDASLMPATGTPEPGGLFWWDALALVERCLAGRVALGFDLVELAPVSGLHAPNYTAARLAYEIMGIIG